MLPGGQALVARAENNLGEKAFRWIGGTRAMCEQQYHGVVEHALGVGVLEDVLGPAGDLSLLGDDAAWEWFIRQITTRKRWTV